MAQITTVTSALLALLVLALLGAPLVQDNLRSVEVKRDHAARLTQWGAERAEAVTVVDAPIQPSIPHAADPCAYLPWLADFPQLAPRPADCAPHPFLDLWTARQSWETGHLETACALWQRWDAWADPLQLLSETVQATAWDDVAALLTCLEHWSSAQGNSPIYRQLSGRMSNAYRSLGDAVGAEDVSAALAAYAAADRWDPNRRRLGTSAAARLLARTGEMDNALALLQTQATDADLDILVRYRLWLEAGDLAATTPDRAPTAQDAFDAARQLRPDQIDPYTRLVALYRNSRPQWSIAAVEAAIDSPAGVDPANRRVLLRLLGDLQRGQAAWEAAACAYRAALAQPIPNDTNRDALQQAVDEMEARLGRVAVCG